MINPWEIVNGIFALIFFLAAFYFVAAAGIRDLGKRGNLLIASIALLGPGFLFDLISEVYENETAELISHGLVILAGIGFMLSFYLSYKTLKKAGGV